jgi:hypothetical protein
VLFNKVDKLPRNLKKAKRHYDGMVTFALGESTGHHHSCVADGVELWEDERGTMWCSVEKAATVKHQEHKPIVLEPGVYEVGIVQEVDPFENEIREVRD